MTKFVETNTNLNTQETEDKSSTNSLKDEQVKSSDNQVKTDDILKRKKKPYQKKICMLCKRGVMHIDYKNVALLKNYLKKNNKIVSHKINGNCLKHQHQVKNSIKRARILAFLPFIGE